jgi:hypothetical protein
VQLSLCVHCKDCNSGNTYLPEEFETQSNKQVLGLLCFICTIKFTQRSEETTTVITLATIVYGSTIYDLFGIREYIKNGEENTVG